MSRVRTTVTDPLLGRAAVLNPVRQAGTGRRFRIVIEGVLGEGGALVLSGLQVQGEQGRAILPLEAEAICRRVAFAGPLQFSPPSSEGVAREGAPS